MLDHGCLFGITHSALFPEPAQLSAQQKLRQFLPPIYLSPVLPPPLFCQLKDRRI